MLQRIAVPTDDEVTISKHFGQAIYFKIVTLEDGRISSTEIREKITHQHGTEHPAGMQPGLQMIKSISDCQVLIAGGMGSPAYQRAMDAGMQVILTRKQDIDEAISDYAAGTLTHDPDLVHMH